MNIGDRVKFITMGGWYNSGIIKDMDEDSYLIEVDELGCKPPKDVHISLPYYARVLSCECVNDSGEGEREINMADDIFEDLTDEERNNLWMYMIFNKDKIIEKTEEWAKKAEEIGMTLTEYLESISPLNNKEPYEDKSESEDNK